MEVVRSEASSNGVSTQLLSLPDIRIAYASDGTAVFQDSQTANPAVMEEPPKRKRGRPRKYQQDSGMAPLAVSPLTSAAAAVMESPLNGGTRGAGAVKKGRGRPLGSSNKKMHGSAAAAAAGIGFTPHVITVKPGEDVYSKIMSFSRSCPHAVCILSANGAISNVTLHQAATSGGTVTYEGRYEILSLSGSFLTTDSGGQRSRTGGLSVSLSGPDGRVLGGGVAGLLTAAAPIQVVVGSFKAGEKRELKHITYRDSPTSAPPKLVPVRMTGISSPPTQGIVISSGSGSSHNQGTGTYDNNNQQSLPNIPWKQG